jgi:diguanylate cyclase (GGDEF)-like protein
MMPENPARAAVPTERFLLELCPELSEETILRRWQHVNAVLRVSMMSGLQMQLDATLNLLCELCAKIAPFDLGITYFWDAKTERSQLRTLYDPHRKVAPGLTEQLPEANTLDLWCRIHRKPARVGRGDHPEVEAVLQATGHAVVLALPLFVNGRVMGSLQLFSADADAFDHDDAQLLWVLVHVAENLLTREHANESLMMFAFTDHLTGLRTRGYFEQQLELEIKRSERKEEAFVLLMLDIDNFKQLNDAHGHLVGDQVLREVASVLTQDMREVDTVARYGGEEFAIILPETTETEGARVAERIRTAVREKVFLADGRDKKLGVGPLALTISIGLSSFPADARNKQALVEFADTALYAAKSRGRDRVVLHSELRSARKEAV